MRRIVFFILTFFVCSALFAQNSGSEMNSLFQIKKGVKTKRVGSYLKHFL